VIYQSATDSSLHAAVVSADLRYRPTSLTIDTLYIDRHLRAILFVRTTGYKRLVMHVLDLH